MRLLFTCIALLWAIACDDRQRPPTSPILPSPTVPATSAPTTFQLGGAVVEIGAGPVDAATVSARSCDESPSYNHVFGQTQTDATGAFQLTIDSGTSAAIGCVYLRADKIGYVSTNVHPSGPLTDPITVRIQRLRRVTGQVFEVDGGPLSDVKVFTGGSSGAATSSDRNGFFSLSGTGGYFWLEKKDYVTREVSVPEGQDVDLATVYLQRAIEVSAVSRLTSRLSSADVYYFMWLMSDEGVFCSPCKAIKLQPQPRALDIEVHWTGSMPLALWIASPRESRAPFASPGESSLAARVPGGTDTLLVGVRSDEFGPQSIPQPITFELFVKEP